MFILNSHSTLIILGETKLVKNNLLYAIPKNVYKYSLGCNYGIK